MSRLEGTFAALKAVRKTAFIPFVMAGDPNAATTSALLEGLPVVGADVIELGIPFSDPMADGPAIQAAGARALAAGMTVNGVLELVRSFRKRNDTTPLVLMGYYNPVYRYGPERFVRDAVAAGVDGLILVDLPPEEDLEIRPAATAAGLDLIRLVSPVTDGQRLSRIAAHASGFVYYVALTGVTGAAAAPLIQTVAAVERIRSATPLPIGVGFGIKTPEDAARFAPHADAVIVGSALVSTLATTGSVPDTLAFAGQIAAAVRQQEKAA